MIDQYLIQAITWAAIWTVVFSAVIALANAAIRRAYGREERR